MIELATYDGAATAALVTEPAGPGRRPAIAFGGEAMGLNAFGRRVAGEIAALGYVTITPDYYRGHGPSQPDNYDDFSEVIASIEAMDFGRATHDVMAGIDWLRAQPNVDPDRVAVWGYCTGATLALLSAGLDRRLAATVLFFPSQPRFAALGSTRPVQPMELIWNIACPVLTIYGDQDPIMPPDLLAEWRARFAEAGVRQETRIYPGAGHAFSATAPAMHHAEASRASWADATAFVAHALARS
jgi:carboxymethylenebutenolidase